MPTSRALRSCTGTSTPRSKVSPRPVVFAPCSVCLLRISRASFSSSPASASRDRNSPFDSSQNSDSTSTATSPSTSGNSGTSSSAPTSTSSSASTPTREKQDKRSWFSYLPWLSFWPTPRRVRTHDAAVDFKAPIDAHRTRVRQRGILNTGPSWHRLKIHKSASMASNVRLATVPTADSPGTSIMLHHEKRTYIFGRMIEGTQRSYSNHKFSFSNLEHIFLSGPSNWAQVGGLFGMILTVANIAKSALDDFERVKREKLRPSRDAHKPPTRERLKIHSGPNITHLLATLRCAIFRMPIEVEVNEQRQDPRLADPTSREPDFADDAIRLWKMPVRRARSATSQKRRRLGSPPHPRAEKTDDVAAADPDGDGYALKPAEAFLSDPEVANFLVAATMNIGGSGYGESLVPKPVYLLKEGERAIVADGDNMVMYKGPYPKKGENLPNERDTVYVLPDKSGKPTSLAVEGSLPVAQMPLPRTTYSDDSMCYLVKAIDRRGKFNPVPARAAGIKALQYRRLIAGETLTGPTGQVVTPDMVMGATIRGNGFIVADIPALDFVDSFLARPELADADLMANIAKVYWLLGPGLSSDARIHAFISANPHMKHIFCADDTCPNMITGTRAAELQTKLHLIDPDRFSLVDYENAVQYPAPPVDSPIELGRIGAAWNLMPRMQTLDDSVIPFANLAKAAKSVDEDIHRMARACRAEAKAPELLARVEKENASMPNPDAEIIALGTGSSCPASYRNVSSTLVRVPGFGSYMFDCGEGTLSQMYRMMGRAATAEVLRGLRCIGISHLHSDHHLGTTSVIKAWYDQAQADGRHNDKLVISCTDRFRVMLRDISGADDIGFHRLVFPHYMKGAPLDRPDRLHASRADMPKCSHLAYIRRVPVQHCHRAHAFEIELTSGLRVAFSGDCRPSTRFAQVCRGTHLLIHECTYDDDKWVQADKNRHTTISEALEVAREMEAKRVLLTHFSQRYMKSSRFGKYEEEEAEDEDGDEDELDAEGEEDGEGEKESADTVHVARKPPPRQDFKAKWEEFLAKDKAVVENEFFNPMAEILGEKQVALMALDFMTVRLGEFRQAACYTPAVEAVLDSLDPTPAGGEPLD